MAKQTAHLLSLQPERQKENTDEYRINHQKIFGGEKFEKVDRGKVRRIATGLGKVPPIGARG